MNQISFMGESLRQYPERPAGWQAFIHALYPAHWAFPPTVVLRGSKEFPDVSYAQGLINWSVFRQRTDAAIIRIGQGGWVDERFAYNWQNARAQGIRRGGYWFFDGRFDPLKQADLLVSLIQSDPPEMEIALDWERNYGGAYEGLGNVVTLMKRVALLLPNVKLMFYTGYYWFINNSNPLTHAKEYDYLKNVPLWLAWYTGDASIVKLPQPWTALQLWQYGTPSLGDAYGVSSTAIDMNVWNGTDAEFYARYGGVTVPPPNGEPMPTYYEYSTTVTRRIRRGAGVQFATIGVDFDPGTAQGGATAADRYTLPADVYSGTTRIGFKGDVWARLYQANGRAVDGWTALVHLGVSQGIGEKLINVTPPPPPPTPEPVFISHTFIDTLTLNGITYEATFTVPNVEYKARP